MLEWQVWTEHLVDESSGVFTVVLMKDRVLVRVLWHRRDRKGESRRTSSSCCMVWLIQISKNNQARGQGVSIVRKNNTAWLS